MMQYLRVFGIVLASVTVALAPQYGGKLWYIILFGVSNGLALALPSVFTKANTNAVPPKG